MLDYKEEKEKKKKLPPSNKVSAGLSPEDQGGQEILTTTLESIRTKISSQINNFDQELEK